MTAQFRRVRRDDGGSAVVEFVVLALLLLVPLVYVVVAVGRVQSGALAVTSAAREAARAYVTAGTPATGAARARAAAALALADQGVTGSPDALRLRCTGGPCLAPGSRVVADVRVRVTVPGVPDVLGGGVLAVPVQARSVLTVDRYRSAS